MSIFTSNRNLSNLIQAALKLKETKQSGAVKEEKPVEAVPVPQVSRSPEVSPLVVNNNFFLTYNNVDMKEGGVSQKVDIAKSYRQDSSVAEEVFGRDYTNAQPRSTSSGSRGAKFSQVRQMAGEDLAKLAEAMRKQLRQELGDDYNSEVVERVISEATNSTLQYFSDNKSTRSSRSYRAQEQDCGFVFAKRLSIFSTVGVYSYNTKALADMFVKNFNAGISRNAEELNTAYAKAHEQKVESFLPDELQGIERRIYEDKDILKQVQARVPGRNITSLEDYSEVVSAVLIKCKDNLDLGLVVDSIALCIEMGVQEVFDKKREALEAQVMKMADVVGRYLDEDGTPSFSEFSTFLDRRGVSEAEKLACMQFLTSFIAEDRGVGIEDAASELEMPQQRVMTRGAGGELEVEYAARVLEPGKMMTRGGGDDKSSGSFWQKVYNYGKDIVASDSFRAAVCVAFPSLGSQDRASKARELWRQGDKGLAVLTMFDPTYHAGVVCADISSKPWYNVMMMAADCTPVSAAAGLVDFGVSMKGAQHSFTYSRGNYASTFPFKAEGMTTNEAAMCHFIYDSLAAGLGLVPGVTSGAVKLTLKGLGGVFKNAGKDLKIIFEFMQSKEGFQVLYELAAEALKCKSTREYLEKAVKAVRDECPNLAALIKNYLIEKGSGKNENRVDEEQVGDLPGGGDVPPYRPAPIDPPVVNWGDRDWEPIGGIEDEGGKNGEPVDPELLRERERTKYSWKLKDSLTGEDLMYIDTQENREKMQQVAIEQYEKKYGSLEGKDYEIECTYDETGTVITGVKLYIKKDIEADAVGDTVVNGEKQPAGGGAEVGGEPKRVGDKGYGLGKVGEDVYGRGYFPGVGLNVYDYMGEGGRIDVAQFNNDWIKNGGTMITATSKNVINTMLNVIQTATKTGDWNIFWDNIDNFKDAGEFYKYQDNFNSSFNSYLKNREFYGATDPFVITQGISSKDFNCIATAREDFLTIIRCALPELYGAGIAAFEEIFNDIANKDSMSLSLHLIMLESEVSKKYNNSSLHNMIRQLLRNSYISINTFIIEDIIKTVYQTSTEPSLSKRIKETIRNNDIKNGIAPVKVSTSQNKTEEKTEDFEDSKYINFRNSLGAYDTKTIIAGLTSSDSKSYSTAKKDFTQEMIKYASLDVESRVAFMNLLDAIKTQDQALVWKNLNLLAQCTTNANLKLLCRTLLAQGNINPANMLSAFLQLLEVLKKQAQ